MGTKLPLAPFEAKSETSGTSRALSAGTPVPTCQEGFGVGSQAGTVVPLESSVGLPQVLGPPPAAEMVPLFFTSCFCTAGLTPKFSRPSP